MPHHHQLLALLADGRFHSGTDLARKLELSRTAVWKTIKVLRDQGIEVFAVRGQGYRLDRPIELLERERILAAISPAARNHVDSLEIMTEIDSTNHLVMERAVCGAPGGLVCLAERQTAGRGRRGRGWVSPFGGNLYLSLLWRFPGTPSRLAGLSLAVGVAVVRALRRCGLADAGVKWPNDIYWQGRKLAGLLLEMAGESSGPCYVVVGLGLNVRLPAAAAEAIDQPWVDLETAMNMPVSRNTLAGVVIEELVDMLRAFAEQGAISYQSDWNGMDVLYQQAVVVMQSQGELQGIAQGVTDDGALLVRSGGVIQRVYSADVSVRPRHAATVTG